MSESKMSSVLSRLASHVELVTVPEITDEEIVARERKRMADEAERANKNQVLRLACDKQLFAKDGKFASLPKEEQQVLLTAVMDALEQDVIDCRASKESHLEAYYAIPDRSCWDEPPCQGLDWEEARLDERLAHLLNAAKNGVFLPDWKERVKLIYEVTYNYISRFSDRAVQGNRDRIQKVATEIDELSGEVPEGIMGKGLEFAPSPAGHGQKVYLDGKFVASVDDVSFGKLPAGNGVVAWLRREQIDSCRIKGRQVAWTVYGWKVGFDNPREVFEDHAYDKERSLRVSAPEVDETGKIVFEVAVDNKTQTKEVVL